MLKKLSLFIASFCVAFPVFAAVAGGPAGSFIRNQDTLQSGTTFYVSSGTVLNLNTATLKFSDGTSMITAASGSGGGGGGSSALGVFKNGLQVSSPTAQINFSGSYWGVQLGGASTATITLVGGNTNYIQNSNTLQSGTTFYISSATVLGQFTVASGTAVFKDAMTLSGNRLVKNISPNDYDVLTWDPSESRWLPRSMAADGSTLEIPWKDDVTGTLGWDSRLRWDYNSGILYANYFNVSSSTINGKLRITSGTPANYTDLSNTSGNFNVDTSGTKVEVNAPTKVFSKNISSAEKLLMNDYGIFEVTKDLNDDPLESLLTLKYLYDDGFTTTENSVLDVDESSLYSYVTINSLSEIQANAGSPIKFFEGVNTDYIQFSSSETLAYTQQYVLPSSTGSVDQVLAIHSARSDGKRALYWKTDTSGGGGGSAPVIQQGDSTIDAAASTIDFSSTSFVVTSDPSGEANIEISTNITTQYFNFFIPDDGSWDNEQLPLFENPTGSTITITNINVTTFGIGSSTVTFQLNERSFGLLSVSGSDIFSTDISVSTGGARYTSFSDNQVAPDSFIVLVTTSNARKGIVNGLKGIIRYRKNQ